MDIAVIFSIVVTIIYCGLVAACTIQENSKRIYAGTMSFLEKSCACLSAWTQQFIERYYLPYENEEEK